MNWRKIMYGKKSYITVIKIEPYKNSKDVKITFEYNTDLEKQVTKFYKKPSTPALIRKFVKSALTYSAKMGKLL